MAEVEITDMRETPRYIRPGFVETMVRVTYRTEKGYTGIVELPKAIATEEEIQDAIRESVSKVADMLGTKIEV